MKALRLFIIASVLLNISGAFAGWETSFEGKGRLVQKDTGMMSPELYLVPDAGGPEFLMHQDYAPYTGQSIWVKGRHFGPDANNKTMLNIEYLVTEKAALLRGQIGQGTVLSGVLKPNDFGSVDIYVDDQEARKQLGRDHIRITIPPNHFHQGYKSYAYRAVVSGIVRGDALYLNSGHESLRVRAETKNVETGDVIVISGRISESTAADEAAHRNHTAATDLPEFDLYDTSDVFVKDQATGELIPANVTRVSHNMLDLSLTPRRIEKSDLFADVASGEVIHSIQEGEKQTFVGRMAAYNHLIIEDAIPFAGTDIPKLTTTRPARRDVKPEAVKAPRARPTLVKIEGGQSGKVCDLSITRPAGPKLYLVKPEVKE